ncbi:endonuclease domain-containing protein [Sphingomonas psychrolutea]|nr:endonuclease domain-containing protein [Sphingomonas psychrolutea]
MLTAPGETVRRARKQRREMSLPEIILWRVLRQRPGGLKFRKQHPAGFYVLDFFCAEVKLAIEIDGEVHARGDQPAFDQRRDAQLALYGIATLRIPASDALRNLDAVVIHIIEAVRARLPLHHLPEEANGPPPPAGEELKGRPCP